MFRYYGCASEVQAQKKRPNIDFSREGIVKH
jgi:hypothetical protein